MADQVHGDQLTLRGQLRAQRGPLGGAAREAVEQQQRRAGAGALGVERDVVYVVKHHIYVSGR